MMHDLEIWKPVPQFEGCYSVSSLGNMRSENRTIEFISRWGTPSKTVKNGKILKPTPSGASKYLSVILKNGKLHKTLRVNRIVCEVFHGPAPSPEHLALHSDGDKNNNNASNLRWGTQLENCEDRAKHGMTVKGIMQSKAKLDDIKVSCIRNMLRLGIRQRDIAKIFGVSQPAIGFIHRGLTWRHVP